MISNSDSPSVTSPILGDSRPVTQVTTTKVKPDTVHLDVTPFGKRQDALATRPSASEFALLRELSAQDKLRREGAPNVLDLVKHLMDTTAIGTQVTRMGLDERAVFLAGKLGGDQANGRDLVPGLGRAKSLLSWSETIRDSSQPRSAR